MAFEKMSLFQVMRITLARTADELRIPEDEEPGPPSGIPQPECTYYTFKSDVLIALL